MLSFYPFFWGDYASKTAGLTQTQHGAYMLFLKHIYCTGEKIADSQKFRVAMAFSDEEREAAIFILEKFFKFDQATKTYDHEKCREVIARAEATHKSAADRGAAGGKARAERAAKKEAELQAELEENSSSAKAEPLAEFKLNPSNQTQTQNPQIVNLKSLSQTLSQVAKPEIPDNLKEELGEMKPIGHILGFPKQGFEGKGFGIGKEKKLTEAEQVATIQAGTSFVNNLSDSAKQRARANAPSWDLVFLAAKYIEGIPERGVPEKGYNAAFPAWCLKYTKGKRP